MSNVPLENISQCFDLIPYWKTCSQCIIFKALCNTMCMQMSENMPGASRVNMLVMVISSKIDCKEIYLKNVFTMRDYLKRFVTQCVCIRLIIYQQSHVTCDFVGHLKQNWSQNPNMYKFFIVFKKKNFQKVDLLPPVYFKILRYTFN